MKKYKVQAILIERTPIGMMETVTNSYTVENYQEALDHLMKKHRSSSSYLYIAMDLETQEIVFKSNENKFSK